MTGPERVRAALAAAGLPDTVIEVPDSAHTAAEAAAALGCDVAQIAKSIVFRSGDRPVVVIASGANRVDKAKVAAALGVPVKRADANFVLAATGFAVGGVSPLGHLVPPLLLLDRDLLALHPIWAAAGSPRHVFRTEAAALAQAAGAMVADVRQDS